MSRKKSARVGPERKRESLPSWPADSVERREVASLVPYARNARTHSAEQIDQLAASIKEWGWTTPVLLDEAGGIIAGHGRVLAAKKLGIATVPCMVAKGWSEAQKRAYVIADNKLALNADWDFDLLRIEIGELKGLDFDLDLTGFSLPEIDGLFADSQTPRQSGAGSLAEKFMIAPFSVLNAREGWWQDRKRAWLALGIQSELGRGDAAPGGSDRPAADYSASERGDGAGRARRKPNAIPGGGHLPTIDKATGKICRSDSRSRPIPGTIAGQG